MSGETGNDRRRGVGYDARRGVARHTGAKPPRVPETATNRLITSLRRSGRHSVTARAARPEIVDNVCCQLYRETHRSSGPGGRDDYDSGCVIDDVGSTRAGRAARREAGRAAPLGPDSLTWKYFGDLRTGMMGVWIGAIQNMYPELGAGVEEHSILLREPLQRVARSVYPIMGVVYDGNRAAQTGEQIKQYHHTIKGVDATGRRYHALNPETFYWAHATFFMLVIKVAEYFCGGLTEAEKRQLFDEHVQWYRMYGMSMRPVPKSWEEFQEYWQRVCRDELEINQATLDIFTDPHSQAEVRADAHAGVGSAVQAAGRGAALDRGRAVRAGCPREGRNAVDTRRRSGAAAIWQAGRAGVSGGPRRNPSASASIGRLSAGGGPGRRRCPAGGGAEPHGAAAGPPGAANALLPAPQNESSSSPRALMDAPDRWCTPLFAGRAAAAARGRGKAA